MILIRKENEIFHNGAKLKINAQKSKGPGNEVVWIGDCDDANGQKWIALKKLKEGENIIEPRGAERSPALQLTTEERAEIEKLENRIREIKEQAKKRSPQIKKPITQMSEIELAAYIEYLYKIKAEKFAKNEE